MHAVGHAGLVTRQKRLGDALGKREILDLFVARDGALRDLRKLRGIGLRHVELEVVLRRVVRIGLAAVDEFEALESCRIWPISVCVSTFLTRRNMNTPKERTG